MLRSIFLSVAIMFSSASLALAQEHSEYVEREDDSSIMGVDETNAQMNAAIDKALETIDIFFTALESGEYPRDSFMLKILTETAPEQYEHMWYVFIEFTEDDKILGYLTHNPYAEGSVYTAGEVYSLDPSMVTDWRYLDGDKLRGDFTTRVVLGFMAQDEPEKAAANLADYHENPLP